MAFNWSNIKTVPDAFQNLLNNQFLADLKFKFADGQIIYAHSLVLSIHSIELYQSFKINATRSAPQVIQVRNASHGTFLSFLKYLYTNILEIEQINVVEIVKLFIKYNIFNGLDRLFNAIISNDEIMCQLLEASINENWMDLQKSCLTLIARNYLKILNTKSFLEINGRTLTSILELEPVSDVDEFAIFKAVVKWTKHASLKVSEVNLRQTLSDDNWKLIRFCSMTVGEFTKCLQLSRDLFTDDEICSIFLDIGTDTENAMGFSNQRRMQLKNKSHNNMNSSDNRKWFDKLFELWYPSGNKINQSKYLV